MIDNLLHLGDSHIMNGHKEVEGVYTTIDGETYFKITNYDQMDTFFMTVVSASDHWLFIASNGGISAGRRNANSPLFPYYTDDKIVDLAHITGSKTLIKVVIDGTSFLWEPFVENRPNTYACVRNIYKNRTGNKVMFEEVNEDLDVVFRYTWTFSEKYGFVKQSMLVNTSSEPRLIEVVDGIQNLLPYGVTMEMQTNRSTLVNAYKKNELDEQTGLGVYSLSSMIVDKAEPSEALSATTTWSAGLGADNLLISSTQLAHFRKGKPLETELDVRAQNGAYFVNNQRFYKSGSTQKWCIVSEVNQSHNDVINLRKWLQMEHDHYDLVLEDVNSGTSELQLLVGMSDGMQLTGDSLSVGRHYSNVLFNIMRGGVFDEGYSIRKKELMDFVSHWNRNVAEEHHSFWNSIPERMDNQELATKAKEYNNPDVLRLCLEFLPLYFSRRHGDPSRPWNYFSINTKNEDGGKLHNYEGNWRDIFQNWEALAFSYPAYIEAFITKFVNASTMDGYNPYRISTDGVDWEVVDEDDPWSYIGYWGDHQLIYLLKLLEAYHVHHPDQVVDLLNREVYVFANVPYRIKSYGETISNPQDTIDFDQELEARIQKRVGKIGSDGKLVVYGDGQIARANLLEKLVISLFTKLYNYVPDAGIWLNTQRPEWNDANNALVGNGVSMVTLYYLRRYLNFMVNLLEGGGLESVEVHTPVLELFNALNKTFNRYEGDAVNGFTHQTSREMLDELGLAGEQYRFACYNVLESSKSSLAIHQLISFFRQAINHLDRAIKRNKREDGMYHSYNLLELTEGSARVSRLYEMLEGQVAVLSAGSLAPYEALQVLDALKGSAMYRADQYSYMLYPDRQLPSFLKKNTWPEEKKNSSKLVSSLLKNGDRSLIEQDNNGGIHFNGSIHNADDVLRLLESLKESEHYRDLVEEETELFLDVFEEMFDHQSFTGRSGTFYGYEGLGSIYWHMVSKLLMATQENLVWAKESSASDEVIGRLIEHYYEIRAGIGINKSPELYGAFPTDPYSHTPGNAGAQQPGMTGQVKEDVINRWAELGVVINEGCVTFDPFFMRRIEFLKQPAQFTYTAVSGDRKTINLEADSLAFTYCQVPVVYVASKEERLVVQHASGESTSSKDQTLSREDSECLLKRNGQIECITVYLVPGLK